MVGDALNHLESDLQLYLPQWLLMKVASCFLSHEHSSHTGYVRHATYLLYMSTIENIGLDGNYQQLYQ